jgi:hypothetical protein
MMVEDHKKVIRRARVPRVIIVSDGPSTSVPVSTEGVRAVHAGPLGPAFAHMHLCLNVEQIVE